MHAIKTRTGDQAYLDLLATVQEKGHLASPRKLPTSAIYDVTVAIEDPVQAPPLRVRTGYAHKIAATETAQLLAGVSSLKQLDAAANGNFSKFSNDGRLLGAYGPRLRKQLVRVEKQLRADPASRQAVVNLWRPDEDVNSRDVPCTLSLTFRVVEDQLDLKVHMRSNDLILGVPYDWFMFSRVQLAMAEVLATRVGRYVHHVDNLHVYHSDEPRLAKFLENGRRLEAEHELDVDDNQRPSVFTAAGGMHRFNTWVQVQNAAMSVVRGSDAAYRRFRWYYDRVTPLGGEWSFCTGCHYAIEVGTPPRTIAICDRCAPVLHLSRPSQ